MKIKGWTGAAALSLAASLWAAPQGRVALHTWNTAVEFKDLVVTGCDGKVLWRGVPDPATQEHEADGSWSLVDGVLRQSNPSVTNAVIRFGDKAWGDYTLRVKARKLEGLEGFILHVREKGPDQCIFANYGGWNNVDHGLESRGNYDFTTPFRKRFSKIEKGRWYDLAVTCRGERVTMSLDGKPLFTDVAMPETDPNAPNVVTVESEKVRFPVAEDQWGIFFEDISLSLDGGVYAELVRNRSFEDGGRYDQKRNPWSWRNRSTSLEYWNPVGPATMTPDFSKPLSPQNTQCVRVLAQPGGGIANDGYFGIAVKKDAKYRLSVAVRGEVKGPIVVSLESLGKPAFALGEITGVGADWQTKKLELTANATDPTAKLVFRAPAGGTFYLDCVSLFPKDTYGTSGLFRKDLMERLAALRPSFVRFPGGCWVEGDTMAEAYRWKKTIGSVWNRRTQWNIWNYWSANGVGFHEYLVLCEELGAKALFCINCGMSHKENVPMSKMGEFVQDALDCIEYANGPVTSKWGAVRAANGHPKPFNLKYLEIGNENGGKAYHERYALIHDAVTKAYPEIKIVSDVWGGPVQGRPQHIRDEHYYNSPDFFMTEGSKMYETRPRGEYEVFAGEYAVTRDVGRWGDLRGAIGEAAFMCALERNADLVKLAAYAPLFANANHTAWAPDLIYPMTDGNFVNPSWNVQKLFSENRGKEVLDFLQTSGWMTAKNGRRCRVISASTIRDADGSLIVKLVNCSEAPQPSVVRVKGGSPYTRAKKTVFTGPNARASNSPDNREALKEVSSSVTVANGEISETLPPLSLTVYRLAR